MARKTYRCKLTRAEYVARNSELSTRAAASNGVGGDDENLCVFCLQSCLLSRGGYSNRYWALQGSFESPDSDEVTTVYCCDRCFDAKGEENLEDAKISFRTFEAGLSPRTSVFVPFSEKGLSAQNQTSHHTTGRAAASADSFFVDSIFRMND